MAAISASRSSSRTSAIKFLCRMAPRLSGLQIAHAIGRQDKTIVAIRQSSRLAYRLLNFESISHFAVDFHIGRVLFCHD
ncbi:DUF1013 domain-containing protein [Citrobacter freundii]|nr:DUF1013 domain-containing protein [Citrobacter freundii]